MSTQAPGRDNALILDRISDGFFVLDNQWRFTRLNKKATTLAPCRSDALIGKNIWKVFPKTLGSVVFTEFHRSVEQNVPVSFVYYSPCLERWYEVNAEPSEDGLIVIFHDTTHEYKEHEAKVSLQRSVALRADVSNALSQSDVALDTILQECAEAVVRHADAALAQIWMMNEAQTALELHANAGMSAALDTSQTRIPVGGTFKIGHVAAGGRVGLTNNVRHDPSICNSRWARREGIISFAGFPLSSGGRVIGVMALFARHRLAQDLVDSLAALGTAMTPEIDRKRTEQALRDSEETLRLAAEATELGTWNWDIPTDTLTANARTRLIFGLSADADLNIFIELIHPDDKKRVLEAIDAAIAPASAGNYEIEYRIIRHDGLLRWVKEKGKVSFKGRFQDRVPMRMVGTVIDITDAKKKEEELRQANKAKDEFLATLSHELRTPLTAIFGWANLLCSGKLESSQVTKAYEVIHRNAKAQIELVDDLLNVSRIIAGKLQITPKWIDPALIIDTAVESIRPAAAVKGINVRLQGNGPGFMFADPDRLQQIIYNLLTNALKFTEKAGEISVEFDRFGDSFQIKVRDTGEGISPEFLPFVFDQFKQADSSTTRKHGGLGLGLHIVRHITELHGGTVMARSEGKGKGTTMTVQLPFPAPPTLTAPADPSDAKKSRPDSLHGVTIMVVEDEQETLSSVGEAVQKHGASVILASSVAEAMAKLDGRKPDVLVSDVMMREMDGGEVIRTIRSGLPPESRDIPAVALSALAGAEDMNRSLLAGYRAHITKPVVVQDLVFILAGLANLRRREARAHP